MVATWGSALVGSADALAGRMLQARQRASALLAAELLSCTKDAVGGRMPQRADVEWEQAQIREAMAVLCKARPLRLSNEDRTHRRDAEWQMLSDGLGLAQ